MLGFPDADLDVGAELALADASTSRAPGLPADEELLDANLYAVIELIAARAPRASSARQYLAIYTRFADRLRAELGRPPVVADVTVDAIAAYSRELERHGGRGGGPCAPATRRAHLMMLRALLKELGLEQRAGGVRVPSHRSASPETLTVTEYGNLIRTPDQRGTAGKRDVALLRLLGDCGLRNLELRQLRARAVRKPRANSRHHFLFVRGKGGVEREIEIPDETYAALERWLSAHPAARRGSALADDTVLFPALAGPDAGKEPLSQQALAKLLSRYGRRAGIPARLAHPHALRAYYATTLSAQGMLIQGIKEKLGHASIETTARYLAKPGDAETAGEAIDRHHQDQNRRRAA